MELTKKYLRQFTPSGNVKFVEKDENYVRLPKSWLRGLKNLTSGERFVLIVLKSYRGQNGLIYPSQITVSQATGYSREQINRIIKSLKKKNAITYERKSNNWHYEILV